MSTFSHNTTLYMVAELLLTYKLLIRQISPTVTYIPIFLRLRAGHFIHTKYILLSIYHIIVILVVFVGFSILFRYLEFSSLTRLIYILIYLQPSH